MQWFIMFLYQSAVALVIWVELAQAVSGHSPNWLFTCLPRLEQGPKMEAEI